MPIRSIVLRTALLAIASLAVVAVLTDAPGSTFIAFFCVMALVGGSIAMLMRSRWSHARGPVTDPFGSRAASTDVINFSSLRVAGLGGLGLVAVCVGIAIALPRVGQTMVVAVVGGALLAWGFVAYRRRQGPLDSSHAQPGGRSVLVEATANPSPVEANDPESSRRPNALMPLHLRGRTT